MNAREEIMLTGVKKDYKDRSRRNKKDMRRDIILFDTCEIQS